MHPSIHAQLTPDKIAYIVAGSNSVVTYKQLDERSNQGAHLLRQVGLQTGDHVCVLSGNDSNFLEIIWAAQRSGLFYTCIPTHLVEREIAFIVKDSGSKVLISSFSISSDLEREIAGCEIFAPNMRNFLEERKDQSSAPIGDEAAGIEMLYSSGTTGMPKGIKTDLPVGGIANRTVLFDFCETRYGMGADMVYLSPAPLYHSAPLRFCMIANRMGATCIIMEKFDPEAALALIERFGVSHAQFVPTHFIRMLKLPDDIRSKYDLSSLQVIIHAAAPCPAGVKADMIEWFGPIISEYYAGTEMNGLTVINSPEWLERPGSVGRPVWGRIQICDEGGDLQPAGTVGAVFFADGPTFEYHNDEAKTAGSRNRHGGSTLGDVGWVDEDGYLYLTDRSSFMIISGGVNIYPQEIENALILHPEVVDVAVIGAPDAEMGEQVVAVIQPASWEAAGPELGERLLEFLSDKVSRTKLPRRIDFDPALPRSDAGKLLKRIVRDRYWPALEASVSSKPSKADQP